MFITIHAAVGLVIGEKIKSPWWTFVISFLLHFPFDTIPHGDEKLAGLAEVQSQTGSPAVDKFRKFVKISAIDGGLLFFLVLVGYGFSSFKHPLNVAAGIFGGILPDLLVAAYFMISKNILLKWFERFHRFCHKEIIKPEIPFKAGLIMQTIVGLILFKLAGLF